MPLAAANGIDIEYESFGEPNNPAILLIMGLGMQLTAWPEQFCRDLAAHGYQVIRYDNRDTGFSTKFDGRRAPGMISLFARKALNLPVDVPYTLRDMADDAVGLMDALKLKTAHVVGASMGGMIAHNLVANHPERVRTLTSVMSTSGHRSLPGADPLVTRHLFFRRPKGKDRESVIAHRVRAMELIGSPAYPIAKSKLRELAEASYDRSFYPQGFSRHVAAIIEDGDRRGRLRTIKSPTLVIHGREDKLVPVAGGIDTANHVPGARLEVFDGMGHNFPIELWPAIIGLIVEHTTASRQSAA